MTAVRKHVGPSTDVIAVVKANAYGHGLVKIGQAAQMAGAAGLGVALADEGVRLREQGITLPILVMSAIPVRQAAMAVRYRLTCTVCDQELPRALCSAAQEQETFADVHLKVDSGMGRLGVDPASAGQLLESISALPFVRLTGIFTHLACAEEPDPSRTLEQIRRFKQIRLELTREGASAGTHRWHLANSAGTARFPECAMDAVRVGLLIYGYDPTSHMRTLEPAACWKSTVSYVKECPAGTPISYGGTFVTPHPMTVATVGVGYADGYPRALSSRGEVLLGGRRARVLGRICMDQMMVEVPAGSLARPGDEVVLMGAQGSERITAEEIAGRAGTILHELLSRLGGRMPRVYIDSGGRPESPNRGTESKHD